MQIQISLKRNSRVFGPRRTFPAQGSPGMQIDTQMARMMGSFWDRFGIALGSTWDQFGIDLGSFWEHFGIILGSI